MPRSASRLEEALARHGKPTIFNTDQGSQFTSTAFTAVLLREKIAVCVDGKGCLRDNVFVERLWSSAKYEEVHLNKGPLEPATLSILQHQLLTEGHAELFAEEFKCDMARLASTLAQHDQSIIERLTIVTREIETLAANMLAAVAALPC